MPTKPRHQLRVTASLEREDAAADVLVSVAEGATFVGNDVFDSAVDGLKGMPVQNVGPMSLGMRQGEASVGKGEHTTYVWLLSGKERPAPGRAGENRGEGTAE